MKELTFIKVGTGVVSNIERNKLDHNAIASIGNDIAQIEGHFSRGKAKRLDHEGSVILVSSGAITAGKEKLGLNQQLFRDVRMQQMAAMVGNTTIFGIWAAATGIVVGHDLPTQNDLSHQNHWDNLSAVVMTNLKYGVLTGLNEGDARSTEELQKSVRKHGFEFKRFGDNDQLTAKFAIKLGSYAIQSSNRSTRVIFLTDTNGVYQDASKADSRIDYIKYDDINEVILRCVTTSGTSNGGMLSKLLAAKDLVAAGINVTIGAGKSNEDHALLNLYNYEEGYGTHIMAS
jgi:glutamate 5-kinase